MPKNFTYPTKPKRYAKWLIKQLKEGSKGAHSQLFRLAELVDIHELHAIYERTLEIEADGGLMTADGERRRTVGGVFFYLAKEILSPDISEAVFQRPWVKVYVQRQKEREHALNWLDRAEVLTKIEQQGTIETMKVTLTGNPGDMIRDGTTVIIQICDTLNYDYMQYPIGTPDADLPPVVYSVYMAEKMWTKVENDLAKPDRVLHVSGVCHFDAETLTIAVLAEHVTTQKVKKLTESSEKDEAEEVQQVQITQEKSERTPFQEVVKPVPVNKAPVEPVASLALPEGVPDTVASKAQELHTAITKFEEKIASLKAKKQTSGLKMTERLLKNADTQLATLLKPYKK